MTRGFVSSTSYGWNISAASGKTSLPFTLLHTASLNDNHSSIYTSVLSGAVPFAPQWPLWSMALRMTTLWMVWLLPPCQQTTKRKTEPTQGTCVCSDVVITSPVAYPNTRRAAASAFCLHRLNQSLYIRTAFTLTSQST